MTAKRSRYSKAKILELKAKIGNAGMTKHKLFRTFDDADDAEGGFSNPEISAVLRPNKMEKTKSGMRPTLQSQMQTSRDISRFRRWMIESNAAVIVPYSEKTEEGWLFYNMQTREDFNPVMKRVNKIIDALEINLREMLRRVTMKQSKKEDVNNEYREEIRKTILLLKRIRR